MREEVFTLALTPFEWIFR